MRNLMLVAVCVCFFTAALDAETVCNRFNIAGTYSVKTDGWVTMGVVGGFPVFAPTKGVGTAKIEPTGELNGKIISVVAGEPSEITAVGTIEVTSDCRVTVQASCAANCAWTLAGFFFENTREANLVFTSQTSGGAPAPMTATLDLKRIGN